MEPTLDTTVPALVFKTGGDLVHHGTLGIIRSLGRLGVPVYAAGEGSFTPPEFSRYLSGWFPWTAFEPGARSLVKRLLDIAAQLDRRAVLVPTGDRAAELVAEYATYLEPWYLFPQLPAHLPRLLANKFDLHSLCKKLAVPSPEMVLPGSLEDVEAFVERAVFPVIVKAADSQAVSAGVRSTAIVRGPEQLLALYRQAGVHERRNLVFQEYIPNSCAEDWIFHGYCNPKTECFVAFTGKKLRSYPPFAGPTALGVAVPNETLSRHSLRLLRAIGYAGIMDLDYRFDKREGQYKLLDFNPRIGANFRMFENLEGVDVVRALHLDLTGRPVPDSNRMSSRKLIVESHDWLASLGYARQGELTYRAWRHSLQGTRELAWFCADDPRPAFATALRLLGRAARRVLGAGWTKLSAFTPDWPPAAWRGAGPRHCLSAKQKSPLNSVQGCDK